MNIVVSGASSGIGYEVAKQAALIPDNLVVAIARSEDKLQALRTDILNKNPDARIYTLPFDLASGDYKVLSHEIFDFANKYDLLINNAGLLINKPLKEFTALDFDQMYQVNSRAVFLLSKVLLPRMPKGSQIINISSMSGFQGSAKFRVWAYTQPQKELLQCLPNLWQENGPRKELQ
jgi:short-subunit dehydrogenase